ncbi:guanylate-binding protein 2-like isoform X2 [Anas acuta]|uniref:guanylate-binding protein 2-like isoform X2 n=1 Tax=Anas acuta TaxID=28680 RepID=UPI0035C92B1F
MAAPPPVPLLLAEPGEAWGGPRLFQAALDALRGAPAPVHVVAAFGPRGSGKSFLLDQLAGPGGAFPSSPGLWLRCCWHPTQPGHALVLLDAAGFPAPGDEEEDEEDPWFLQLLVLQLLLASVFVYSSGAAAEPQEELERLTYVRALPRRLRLLEAEEEEEDEEDEGSLLRTVLPPFVWSLHGAAAAPEDEAVLEAEGHELWAALGPPPGPEAPVARRVLALFPEHKLFRLEAGGAGGLPELCAHLLGCGPKTGLSGEPVGGAYLAALAERAAEALCGAEPLRVARLCREAEEVAWQDEAEDVTKLWCGDEVTQLDAAEARWGGGDGKGDGSGDAGKWQELGDAWQSDAASQWDINAWLGDTMTDEDVNAWLRDARTKEDATNARCGGDGDTQRDVNARHGDAIKEEDEVEIWSGGAATQRDVNLSKGAAQQDANTGHGDTVTEEDATNAWCGGDGDAQRDVNAHHGDAVKEEDEVEIWSGGAATQRDVTARCGDTPEAMPRPKGGAMGAPKCLVQNGPNGKLSLNPEVLEVLRGIGQPVVVVAIAGRYRTGKSFLMNRLAQQQTGFPLGHTVQAETKGIWMWCLPHPCRADTTLVLLDTEGLWDPDKGDSRNDAWIFTLALLLSSTLVYNSTGTIDQQALENLGVVTALTDRVRVRAGDSRDAAAADFMRFFPGFVWAVRDFVLELSVDGRRVNEDEYLEHVLRLQPGSSRVVQEQNELRRCLRDFFPNRKCFVLPLPAEPEAMKHLEELKEGQLRPRFLQQADAFCRHIWDTAPVKALPGQVAVTGSMLASLAERYVEAIGSSGVLCLESAVTALAAAENTAAVAAAVAEYRRRMERELKLPTASQEELGDAHQRCERRALALFMARVFADKEQRYQCQLMSELEAAKEEFCRRNEAASEERCRAVLQELWRDVERRLDRGEYAVPGGSRRFQEHLGELMEKYHQRPGLGVKAAAVLEKFLQEHEVLVRALCAADQHLSEHEKERVASEAVAAAAAAAKAATEEAVRAMEARQEEQRRSREEHQRQLEEQLWHQQWVMLEEQERVIKHKLQEQEALLKEGFEREAEALREQIRKLQKEKEEMKKPSWIQWALDGLGIAADIILPGLTRVAVSGALRLFRRK